MPSVSSALTAAAALLSVAGANPVEKRGSFTLEQVEGPKILRNGAVAMAKTYKKYGKAVPAELAAAAAAAQQGAVTASPSDQYDSSYLVPVSVGGKTLNLDFDTGSSDLWVFSSLQPASQRSGHNYYTVNSAKKLQGETWNIQYGDGSGAAGTVYADQVVVGAVTATSQAVEAATSVSSEFIQDTTTDGLLGLAFSSINTVTPDQQTTFFDTVKSTLSSPLFAADLKYHAAGAYDFGFIDTSKFSGSITYTTVNTANGFWEFNAGGYAVGSGSTVSSTIDVIADTGTTLIYLPTSVVKAYYKQVSGAQNSNSEGGYIFPCSATLPNFTVVISGVKHTVPGEYINYSPVSQGSSSCFGGIQSNTGIGLSILGDVFLKSQYVVFDETTGSPRIGFAQQS